MSSEVVARGRNVALLAGGVGTSLFIGFAIAFLRMWGLAFTAEPDPLGAAVTTQDSDIYFYLAGFPAPEHCWFCSPARCGPAASGFRPAEISPAVVDRPDGVRPDGADLQ